MPYVNKDGESMSSVGWLISDDLKSEVAELAISEERSVAWMARTLIKEALDARKAVTK
jgi:predicted transcriptional regulator